MKINRFEQVNERMGKIPTYDDLMLLSNQLKSLNDKYQEDRNDIKYKLLKYNYNINEIVVFLKSSHKTHRPIISRVFDYDCFIPSHSVLSENSVIISDSRKQISISIRNVEDIKTLDQVHEEDKNLFLELYNFYVKDNNVLWDIFGKKKYRATIDSQKYNL